jgi:hypothetical protein
MTVAARTSAATAAMVTISFPPHFVAIEATKIERTEVEAHRRPFPQVCRNGLSGTGARGKIGRSSDAQVSEGPTATRRRRRR